MNQSTPSSMPRTTEIRPTPLWWTKDRTGRLYFAREFTGVLIAAYLLAFLAAWAIDPSGSFVTTPWFKILSGFGLSGAVFHSLTWLGVTLKVGPIDLPRWMEVVGFLGLLLAWAAVSIGAYQFLYKMSQTYIYVQPML